jgi:hypothetical protein
LSLQNVVTTAPELKSLNELKGAIDEITAYSLKIEMDLSLFIDSKGNLRASLHVPREKDSSYQVYFIDTQDFALHAADIIVCFDIDPNKEMFEASSSS